MSTRINHAHKLKRHTFKTGSQIYICVLDCSFRIACELALGKRVICWRCGKEFHLNQYSISLAKPHCEDCHIFKSDILKNKKTNPIKEVTTEMASSVVSSLKDRLSGVVTNQPEVKEYKPDDEEVL